MIERELKFKTDINISNKLGTHDKINYTKDEIYGNGIDKIRKRITLDKVEYQKTIPMRGDVKTIIEKDLNGIPSDYKLENSYDKVRITYFKDCIITIDIYFFGVFLEIEGDNIEKVAEELGFDLKDNIVENIDTLYCKWSKENRREELMHWGFGKL